MEISNLIECPSNDVSGISQHTIISNIGRSSTELLGSCLGESLDSKVMFRMNLDVEMFLGRKSKTSFKEKNGPTSWDCA